MRLNDMLNYKANREEVRRRFMLHVRKKREHWIWINDHNNDGQFYLKSKEVKPLPLQTHPKGKNVSARRLMFLLAFGEIPPGVNVKTICSVPACVRPEHLSINGKAYKIIEVEDALEGMRAILDAKPNV